MCRVPFCSAPHCLQLPPAQWSPRFSLWQGGCNNLTISLCSFISSYTSLPIPTPSYQLSRCSLTNPEASCLFVFALSVSFSWNAFLIYPYWNSQRTPPPGNLLNPGIEPASPAFAGRSFTTEPPQNLWGVVIHAVNHVREGWIKWEVDLVLCWAWRTEYQIFRNFVSWLLSTKL